jgi:hypothetical protein
VLTLAEIVRSTYGAWRLAHADPSGMSYFDATEEGFWRSFRVAILVAPAYALLVAFNYAGPPIDAGAAPLSAGLPRIVAVEAIAYALNWIAYPLAAYYLAQALDREREYVGYIVAYNWSSVVQLALLVPVDAITTWELLPLPIALALWTASLLAVLAYAWFIAKTALKVTGLIAAALVAMGFLLEFLILSMKQTMIY